MTGQKPAKRSCAMWLDRMSIIVCIILLLAGLVRLLFLFELIEIPVMLAPQHIHEDATYDSVYSAFDNSALSLADRTRGMLGLSAIERNYPRATYYFTLARTDEDAEALPVIEYINSSDEVYFRPPLYVYFLGMLYFIFGDNQVAIHLVQMTLGLCNALLAYALARRMCGRTVALFALTISAFYWPLIVYENLHHDQILVACCLLLTAHCALRWSERRSLRNTATLAAMYGITLYGSPALILFIPVLAVWMAWVIYRNERTTVLPAYRMLRHIAVYGLIVCVFLVPGIARNYYVSNRIHTQFFLNLIVFDQVQQLVSGKDINKIQYVIGPYWDNNPDHREVVAQMDTSLGVEEIFQELGPLTMPHILSNPMAVARHSLSSALRFWSPSERVANDIEHEFAIRFLSPTLRRLPGSFAMIFIPFVLGLGCLGCIYLLPFVAPRANQISGNTQHEVVGIETVVFLLLFIAVWYAPFIFISARAVYRLPLVPLLSILGAWGFARIHTYARSRNWLGLTCAATPAIVLLPVMLMVPVSYEEGVRHWYEATLGHLEAHNDPAKMLFAQRGADYWREDADLQYKTAVLLLHEGNDDIGAFHYYVRAMNACAPHRSDFIAHLADQACRMLLQFGEDDRTDKRAIYDHVLNHAKHERHTMIALARSFLLHGAADKTAAFLAGMRNLISEDATLLHSQGETLNGHGKTESAIAALARGVERYPDDALLYLELADILAKQGNVAKACEVYRKILELDPGNEEAQRAMADMCEVP